MQQILFLKGFSHPLHILYKTGLYLGKALTQPRQTRYKGKEYHPKYKCSWSYILKRA
jgi:hypothetical protein